MRTLLSTLPALAVGLFVSANAFAQDAPEAPAPAPGDLTLPLQPPPAPPNETALPPVAPQPLALQQPVLDSGYPGTSMWGSAIGKPMRTERRWYGWQTLAILGSVDLLSVIGIAANSEPLQAFALYALPPTHLLAGPIVHLAHGHAGRGFGMFGLNVGLPAAGILPGLLIALETKGENAIFVMMGLGMLAAHSIDLALYSFEEVKVPLRSSRNTSPLLPSSVAMLPMLDADKRGLALVGQF